MTNSECIFCKIIAGKIPSTKVFENENVFAFKDLHPQASIHHLFIHKKHTHHVNEMALNDPAQFQDIFQAIHDVTSKEGMTQNGFRVVTNLGPYAGQTVFHTHFHLLGGEPLGRFGK